MNRAATLAAMVLVGSALPAQDWPQWRGAKRDGKSTETGLLREWPEGGPKMLWSVDGLGAGFSTVSIVGETLYTTGYHRSEGTGYVYAIGLDGKLKWKKPYGPEYTRQYPAARTTPTIDDGRGYVMSSVGRLLCFDAKTGEKIWSVDTFEKFGGRQIRWALAESPLIDGDNVICTPGGPDATLAALDKKTGKTVWTTKGLGDKSAYCSPIAFDRGPTRLIATVTENHFIGVNAKDGTLLWKTPFRNRWQAHPNTPIYHDGCVYATAGYNHGGICMELSADGTGAKIKWTDKTLDTHHGNVILLDGCLYGASWISNGKGNWVCLDFKTGQVKYDEFWHHKGSIRYADGMLYLYDERGNVGLAKATPEKFQIISSFKVTKGKGQHWAHPVVAGGRLYIRHGDVLMAYDIKAK
jgi:outer membrane protein assembly factor BamB